MATKKMAMGGGAKAKAASSKPSYSEPTEAAKAARQAQLAKAGERLKAEEATMSEAGKARIKAAQEAATAQAKRNPGPKPYADAIANAIKAKQASMPARPTGGMSAPARPAMPPRPMGGMGARAGMTRPAMGGMGMKKGGATKAKKK